MLGTTRLYNQNTVGSCITKKHINTLRDGNLEFENRDLNMASTEASTLARYGQDRGQKLMVTHIENPGFDNRINDE